MWEEAALREVEEETGMRAPLAGELTPPSYTDFQGPSKAVRYYGWTSLDEGSFTPQRRGQRASLAALERRNDLV